MMSRKLWIGILVFGIMLIGCKPEPEPTYTVWTDTMSYSSYVNEFEDELSDGYYWRAELTNPQFDVADK